MNTDPYRHTGKPLNKTILREILPEVYQDHGREWMTVEKFRDCTGDTPEWEFGPNNVPSNYDSPLTKEALR